MFQKVLVPLDGSELAEQALGQAAAIVRGSHGALDILLVHEPVPFEGLGDAPWNATLFTAEKKYVESIANEISAGAGVSVTSAVAQGARVDMICKRVREISADLIVMTSHGRTGLSRAWLGSTADGVMRHSATPVLMLRPVKKVRKAARLAAQHLFKHVLVPLDGSALAADALSSATALAGSTGAAITVLRVVMTVPLITVDTDGSFVYPYPFVATDDAATKNLVNQAKKELTEVVRHLVEEGISKVESEVVVAGNAAEAIIDFARGHGVDVIAMSTHGRGASRVFLGSVADKLIRASGLPMLVHRPIAVRERNPITEASTVAQLSGAAGA
jgi:nucleotide-binding universal stress UspA family protein